MIWILRGSSKPLTKVPYQEIKICSLGCRLGKTALSQLPAGAKTLASPGMSWIYSNIYVLVRHIWHCSGGMPRRESSLASGTGAHRINAAPRLCRLEAGGRRSRELACSPVGVVLPVSPRRCRKLLRAPSVLLSHVRTSVTLTLVLT